MSKKEATPRKRITSQWAILRITTPGNYTLAVKEGIKDYRTALKIAKEMLSKETIPVAVDKHHVYQPVVLKGPPLVATRTTRTVVSFAPQEDIKANVT